MQHRRTRRVQTVEVTRVVDEDGAVRFIVSRAPCTPDEVVWYCANLDDATRAVRAWLEVGDVPPVPALRAVEVWT